MFIMPDFKQLANTVIFAEAKITSSFYPAHQQSDCIEFPSTETPKYTVNLYLDKRIVVYDHSGGSRAIILP